MLGWLHTADHKGGALPVQEAEGAPAAGDRTGIMGFTMFQQEDSVAVHCADHRQQIFLCCCIPIVPPVPGLRRPHGRTSAVFLR